MYMYFWFGIKFEDFLFEGYTITSFGSFFATCLGLTILSLILEGIKVYAASLSVNDEPPANERDASTSPPSQQYLIFKRVSVLTSWYIVQDIIGNILMLAVMSYNFYFTVAVILGRIVGYFVFGPWQSRIRMRNNEKILRSKRGCGVCAAEMERMRLLDEQAEGSMATDDVTVADTDMEIVEMSAEFTPRPATQDTSGDDSSKEQTTVF